MAADFFTMPIRGRPLSVRDSGVDVGKSPLGFVANHRHCPKDQAIQGARNPSDSHVVVAWIGHSETVARKHYLQTTDAHFEKAVISKPAELVASSEPKTATEPSELVAIQVASETREMAKTDKPRKKKEPGKTQCFTGFCG